MVLQYSEFCADYDNNYFKNYKNVNKWEKNAAFQFGSANFVQRAPSNERLLFTRIWRAVTVLTNNNPFSIVTAEFVGHEVSEFDGGLDCRDFSLPSDAKIIQLIQNSLFFWFNLDYCKK